MSEISGDIGYFKLADWWLSEFTPAEREYIESVYKPLTTSSSSDSRPLTQGKIEWASGSATGLLSSLAGWFRKPEDRSIAHRMLAKADQFLGLETDVLFRHFYYQTALEIYYKDRAKPEFFQAAIHACLNQINLAPEASMAFKHKYPKSPLPSHVGFKQLAIIREKQGDKSEAIRLCQLAKAQGWSGDWDRRIERYSKT